MSQKRFQFSRRRFLQWGVPGGMACGAGSFAYGTTFERHWVEMTRPRVNLKLGPDAPSRFRLALLADFHFDPLCEIDFARHYVRLVNSAKPDLILLLGDFVSDETRRVGELASALSELAAPSGVYGVLGNHDFWHGADHVQTELENAGIPVLRNQLRRVAVRGGRVAIAGLESCWGGRPNPPAIMPKPGERFILAQHEPDYVDRLPSEIRQNLALQVSGHTHGGQICAPFGIVLVRPHWGQRYVRGLYDLGDETRIYVNRGIGTLSIHARFACRPEITLLEVNNRDAPQ